MNQAQFRDLVDARITHCINLLEQKSNEYSADGDKLHNFKSAAATLGVTPQQALLGMAAKHWVSIVDLVMRPTPYAKDNVNDVISEKFTDMINYLLLLEALYKEDKPVDFNEVWRETVKDEPDGEYAIGDVIERNIKVRMGQAESTNVDNWVPQEYD